MDNSSYFNTSDEVENKFQQQLNNHYTFSYDEKLDWFLGMKFE